MQVNIPIEAILAFLPFGKKNKKAEAQEAVSDAPKPVANTPITEMLNHPEMYRLEAYFNEGELVVRLSPKANLKPKRLDMEKLKAIRAKKTAALMGEIPNKKGD